MTMCRVFGLLFIVFGWILLGGSSDPSLKAHSLFIGGIGLGSVLGALLVLTICDAADHIRHGIEEAARKLQEGADHER